MIEWFDDLAVGIRFKMGEAQITAPDIKRFAAEFDPQPTHLDEHTAAKTFFKSLAASGWHSAAIAMRLLVESRPFGDHPIIGIGGGVRWMARARPGDLLHLEGEVESIASSKMIPGRFSPAGATTDTDIQFRLRSNRGFSAPFRVRRRAA